MTTSVSKVLCAFLSVILMSYLYLVFDKKISINYMSIVVQVILLLLLFANNMKAWIAALIITLYGFFNAVTTGYHVSEATSMQFVAPVVRYFISRKFDIYSPDISVLSPVIFYIVLIVYFFKKLIMRIYYST